LQDYLFKYVLTKEAQFRGVPPVLRASQNAAIDDSFSLI
jgi:hypothetical protein